MFEPEYLDAIRRILECEGDTFQELVDAAELLDPQHDFRFSDLADIDFGNADLRGFDFTGANMEGAHLASARLDESTRLPPSASIDQRFVFEEVPIIHDWEMLVSDPRFVEFIDPHVESPIEILCAYQVPTSVKCGLTDCRTPHYRGFLVATNKGRATNIGNHCGTKYFGDTFDALVSRYKNQSHRNRLMREVNEVYAGKSRALATLHRLRDQPFGMAWIERALASYYRVWPLDAKKEIHLRATRNDALVTTELRLSEVEIEKRRVAERTSKVREYEQFVVGYLKGLETIKDPPPEIARRVEAFYEEIDGLESSRLSNAVLHDLKQRAAEIAKLLAQLPVGLDAARRFFEQENVKLLKQSIGRADLRDRVRHIKWLDTDGVFASGASQVQD